MPKEPTPRQALLRRITEQAKEVSAASVGVEDASRKLEKSSRLLSLLMDRFNAEFLKSPISSRGADRGR